MKCGQVILLNLYEKENKVIYSIVAGVPEKILRFKDENGDS